MSESRGSGTVDGMTETSTQTQTQAQAQPPSPTTSIPTGKRIHRSRTQRMLAGVSGGIGEYLGVDPTIVRLGFVLTAFFGSAGIVAYLVAWLIIPES